MFKFGCVGGAPLVPAGAAGALELPAVCAAAGIPISMPATGAALAPGGAAEAGGAVAAAVAPMQCFTSRPTIAAPRTATLRAAATR
jgi:hypothetical protein